MRSYLKSTYPAKSVTLRRSSNDSTTSVMILTTKALAKVVNAYTDNLLLKILI
jgi:hypothetical protein